jgi:hypothetical protein
VYNTLGCPAVAGKPSCSQWDFESGTSEGWQLVLPDSTASAGPLVTSTSYHSTGAASLAIGFNNGADTSKYVEIRVQLCAGGNLVSLSGKHVHWSFHKDNPPTQAGGDNRLLLYGASFSGSSVAFEFNDPTDNSWQEFDTDIASQSSYDQIFGIGFYLQATDPYSGTLYLSIIELE